MHNCKHRAMQVVVSSLAVQNQISFHLLNISFLSLLLLPLKMKMKYLYSLDLLSENA